MIGFRVDANEHIATGHLMRCIAIALECRKLGTECKFYLAEDKLTERLQTLGFPYQILNSKWDDLEFEIEKLKNQMQKDCLEWLVVDSYLVTKRYLTQLNKICKVMYIDDMALEKYDVSALLHYDSWEDAIVYQKQYEDSLVKVLAGTMYAPLREEFRNHKYVGQREKSILFTTGGTDPFNVTMSFLKHLQLSEELMDFECYVIVGNMNNHEDEIRNYAKQYSKIHVLKNIKNMSHYMERCSYAVSAGGTTLYELCACKIPTVCISFAENQIDFAKKMDEKKVMLYAGDARYIKDIGKDISEKLLEYMRDEELMKERIQNMTSLVDGNGAIRIAQVLTQ